MYYKRLTSINLKNVHVNCTCSYEYSVHVDNGEIVPVKVEPGTTRTVGIQTVAINVKLFKEGNVKQFYSTTVCLK